VQDDWGAVSGALSYLHGSIDFNYFGPNELAFQVFVLSSRYNATRFSLTTELQLTDFQGDFGGFTLDSKSDGGYLQGDFFLTPEWSLMARWDSTFSDRNDRNGTNSPSICATNTSTGITDRHNCFAHDFTVGGSWKSTTHWGVWGEYHLIDGLASASGADNAPGATDPHWSMFLLTAAYRF
jgi:hypothetical protein